MRLHCDFGYFCWQFVWVVQPNVGDHESEEGQVVDLSADPEDRAIGFQPNEEE